MISKATSPFSLVDVAKRIQSFMLEFHPRGLPDSTLEFLNGVQTIVGALGTDTHASLGRARDANTQNNPM